MPNQLSKTKRRKSLADHEAILFILEELAQQAGTTSMNLMRQAVRELIKARTKNSLNKKELLSSIMKFAPKIEQEISTPSQLSRFKRRQREFDKVLLDLDFVDSASIEDRNSIVSPQCDIHVLELEPTRSTAAAGGESSVLA